MSLYVGDVRDGLRQFAADGVRAQMCVTSPPFWGLRDYGTATWDGGDAACDHRKVADAVAAVATSTLGGGKKTTGHLQEGFGQSCGHCGARRIDRQIGLEPTPAEYVATLVDVFRLVRDVLADDGTLWLNLGSSYATGAGKVGECPGGGAQGAAWAERGAMTSPNRMPLDGFKPKDMVPIPWMVAMALQADGWYLRSDIIWCLSGGAWIYARTQKGDMPIMVKDLVRLDPATVKLWNGEKWTQVLGWGPSTDESERIELVLRSGERIGCTGGHQWPTARGDIAARELRAGDALLTCQLPQPNGCERPAFLTDDALWLTGLYLAEGSRSGSAIQLALCADEIAWLPRIASVARYYGGTCTHTVTNGSLAVRLYGDVLRSVIDAYIGGAVAIDKHLKVAAWRLPNDALRLLVQGYLDGDGHDDEGNDRWRLGFCRNYALERDIRTAAARLGAMLTLNPGMATYQGGELPIFRGEWRWTRSGHRNEKDRGEIVEIRASRARGFWDIAVADEPHLFALASGVLTHNCKPNPMPESVTDRPTKAHEYLFLLTKRERYYYDAAAIAEPATYAGKVVTLGDKSLSRGQATGAGIDASGNGLADSVTVKADRNRRTVWTIATEPYADAHFATFPTALVEPCVLAGTSQRGHCPQCGAGWTRQWKHGEVVSTGGGPGREASGSCLVGNRGDSNVGKFVAREHLTTGWAPGCACGLEPVPGVVLDPFMGSGTVAQVAQSLGRRWIGCELSEGYAAMIRQRSAQLGMAFV